MRIAAITIMANALVDILAAVISKARPLDVFVMGNQSLIVENKTKYIMSTEYIRDIHSQ